MRALAVALERWDTSAIRRIVSVSHRGRIWPPDLIHTLTRLIDDDVILHLAGVWQLNYKGNGPNLDS